MSITPGVNQAKVVEFITDTYRTWKGHRIDLEQTWKDCFFRAFSRWPSGAACNKGTGLSEQYYHPTVENMVDTVAAQLTLAAVPSDRFFTMLARNAQAETKADDANAILRYVHMKNRLRKNLGLMIRQAVITGNAPWHVTWAMRQTSVPDQEELAKREEEIRAAQDMGQPSRQLIIPTKPLVTYAGPDVFATSIFDFVVDPWPEDEERALRMRRIFKDPLALKANAQVTESGYRVYENVDAIVSGEFPEGSDSLKQEMKSSLGLSVGYEGKDKVELIEVFGDFPVTFGEDSEVVVLYNHIAVIANRRTLLRLEPLPFEHGMLPCGLYKLIPRPGQPYGAGLVERCLGLHDAILERFNQSIIAHAMAINPMWFYKPDGLFDPDEFEAFPGALFPYSGEMPRPFEVPDRAMEGFKEVALLKAEISEAAGSVMDLNTAGARSATESNLVASMGNARFADMAIDMEETITTIVRQEFSLVQQLLSDRVWVRVTHPENPQMPPAGRMVGREDIMGEFDIYCTGASQIRNGAQQMQILTQVTGAVAQTPAASQIDWAAYAGELFELGGLRDASSRFFMTPEKAYADPLFQQFLQFRQAAMANGAGPGGTPGAPGQSGMGGPASLPGLPENRTAGPHPALGPGGLGGPASLPGRRPLGA